MTVVALGLVCSSSYAQVSNSYSQTLWDFVTTGSNYFAVPYGTYSLKDHSIGGGVAVGYTATEVIHPIVRIDYFSGTFYMASVTAQLQPPKQLLGKFPITPIAIAGSGIPFSGAGKDNGTFITILGAGAVLKFADVMSADSTSFLKRGFLAVDYERWLGLPSRQESQLRVGLGVKF